MKRTFAIELGDEIYEVTPSFSVIERIEQRFDLFTFSAAMARQRPKYGDMAWVIYSALVDAGYNVKYKEIGQVVTENFAEAYEASATIASECMGHGPEKPSKKKEEMAVKNTPESESSTE